MKHVWLVRVWLEGSLYALELFNKESDAENYADKFREDRFETYAVYVIRQKVY